MIGWLFSRYWADQKRLRQRASLVCPCHTGQTLLLMAGCALAALALALAAVSVISRVFP